MENFSQHRLEIFFLHPLCFPILLTHKVLTAYISKEGHSWWVEPNYEVRINKLSKYETVERKSSGIQNSRL